MLTTSQAAVALGVSLRRVQQLIKTGVLSAETIGRMYLIQPRSLERARKRLRRPGAGRRKVEE